VLWMFQKMFILDYFLFIFIYWYKDIIIQNN
jgi:hypothetical protein